MNSWLGADENARRWRQVLNLNVLDTQAALGYRADAGALREVHAGFQIGTPGLDHTVFQQVDRAIKSHLDQLADSNIDVPSTIAWSRSQFRATTMSDMEQLRSTAVYEIKLLKRFYKTRLSSRPRALLYHELKPDESIEFLEDIEFELPPARNREVISTEIKSIEQQIENIDEQIDQLNEQRSLIEQWLEGIKNVRPDDGVEPPGPDDGDDQPPMPDDSLELRDQTEAGVNISNATLDSAAGSGRQDELERLEARRLILQNARQKLEDEIEVLKQEVVQLNSAERERVVRFRKVLTEFNRFLNPYEKLRTTQIDVYFGTTFQALNDLKQAYLNAANPGTPQKFVKQLDKLLVEQAELSFTNDRRAAAQVGYLAGWLESAGQASELISAIKAKHSLPNFYLGISNRLVNQFGSQSVKRAERVNEQILSRLIRGTADVDGVVSVQFTPDPYQVRASIDFSGEINSDTYTRSGRFTAYAGAQSQFNVRRDIFANVGGMFACDVYGDLQLGSWFKSIDSNLRLVQRIALKQYYKSKARSEEISEERTKNRIFPQFEEQTDDAVNGGYEQFEYLNQQQTDTGKVLPSIYLHTTSDRLVAIGHRASQFDLAAPIPFDNSYQTGSDIEVRLHESLASNYVSPLLAGRKLTNKQIASQFEAILGEPVAAEDQDEGDDFSITFDDARPVQFEFEDSRIAVTISGKEFSRDGDRIRDGMRIRLEFKIADDAGRLRLIPAADPSVELIDEDRKNIKNVSFISFLESKLATVFEEAFKSEVILPANLIPLENLGPNIKSVADKLKLTQLRMQKGWAYAAWAYQKQNAYYQFAVDLPGIWSPPQPDDEPLDLIDQNLPPETLESAVPASQ